MTTAMNTATVFFFDKTRKCVKRKKLRRFGQRFPHAPRAGATVPVLFSHRFVSFWSEVESAQVQKSRVYYENIMFNQRIHGHDEIILQRD